MWFWTEGVLIWTVAVCVKCYSNQQEELQPGLAETNPPSQPDGGWMSIEDWYMLGSGINKIQGEGRGGWEGDQRTDRWRKMRSNEAFKGWMKKSTCLRSEAEKFTPNLWFKITSSQLLKDRNRSFTIRSNQLLDWFSLSKQTGIARLVSSSVFYVLMFNLCKIQQKLATDYRLIDCSGPILSFKTTEFNFL